MQLVSFLSGAVPGTILTLSTAAIFLYGGKLVIDGAITTGTLVALMSYHMRLLSPVQNLMSLYSNLVSGGVSLSRVWELFDTRTEIVDCPGAQPLGNVRGEIEFDQRFVQLRRRCSVGRPIVSGCGRDNLRDPGPEWRG